MPIYVIEGKRVSAAKPLTDAEIDEIAASIKAEDSEKRGIYAGLARGTRQLASDIQTALGSVLGGEEAALAGIERGEAIARERGTGTSLEDLKKVYAQEGALGAAREVGRSIPEEIAAQAPQIAATIASGAAGAAAGAALGGPAAPITGAVGGIYGALTPSYLQQYAGNIERQAQEDIAAGREVDVSRAAAAAAAVPQAALDVASQFIVVGRILGKRIFGEVTEEVYNLLRKGERAEAEKLAKEGLIKTIGKGTAVGAAVEIPTEVAQSALERAQAGLPVTSDDAFKEYGEVAYKTGLLAPLGTVGRLSERSAARREVGGVSPDLTQETEQERIDAQREEEIDTTPPPPPAPSSLDAAPPELRKILENIDTPKKAAQTLRNYEARLTNLSEDLADPEGMEEDARKAGVDPIELEERLMRVAENLRSALPFVRLRLEELSGTPVTPAPAPPVAPIPQTAAAQQQLIEPAPPTPPVEPIASTTPTTPMPAIPQGAGAQQTLQIDQAVAQGLGLPGAETAPKTEPFTVSTGAPIAPIAQTAGAQQALPIAPTETVEEPLYRQAVEVVLQSGSPTVGAIQNALKINYSRAARFLERMQLEGIVSKVDKETGTRKITMGQAPEVSRAAEPTTPRVAETVEREPVGGGFALPPPGPEPAGRVSEVAAVEPVGTAAGVAPDVVSGAGTVEPALRDIEAEIAALDRAEQERNARREEVKNFARASARQAFDTRGDYRDLQDSIDSNRENIRDTLNEGVFGKDAVDFESEAFAVFDAEIERLSKQTAPKRRGQVPPQPVVSRQEAESAAAETVQGWSNAPEVIVLDNENDTRIPRGVQIAPEDKGFYHEGKAYVIASRASDRADVHATVYHEGLGHFGLKQKFRNRLDDLLNDIYDTNPTTRAAADAIKTPGMSNARAVEEVLATKSEAGPIKEAGIRAAFNRVTAFVRRIGRAMGIKFKYSNNDVMQIVRLAQQKVTQGKREVAGVRSVAAAKKVERELLDIPVKKLEQLGALTPDRAEAVRAFIEGMSDKARPFYLLLRSLPELTTIYGSKIPSIKGLEKIITRRVTKLREIREEIEDNIRKWNAVLSDKQYKGAIINKFYRVAITSTEEQIDFRPTITKNGRQVANPDYKPLDPLTREFESLPQPLQNLYFQMLDAYRKMADKYIDLVTKNLPPTAANILRREFESRRLKVYLPLFREGEYWIRYQDRNNRTWVEAYVSPRQRLLAIRAHRRAGHTNIQKYSKIENAMEDTGAGGPGNFGFFSQVNSELNKYYKGNVPGELKQALYNLYLNSIPASSVRQQFRKREGYAGGEKDLLRVYANVASRMANQLTNLEFTPEFDGISKLIDEDVAKDESTVTQQVQNELKARINFFRNPTDSKWINRAVFTSYADFIMGNISSAFANTVNLPAIVYPMLGPIYGYDKVAKVMQDSMAMYMQGGWDRGDDPNAPKKFPRADRTIFDPSKVPPNSPLGRLFEEAVRQGAIKHSVGYDIMDARDRKPELYDYIGMWNGTKQFLGWTFQNTERFNREVTLVSAFRLEMEKARSEGRTGRAVEKEAIEKAINFANESNGETLAELSPRIFQKGPLKVFLTFKRFARAMYAVQLKLLRDGLVGSKTDTTGMSPQDKAEAEAADREFRKVAIKQWLGTVGGAFTFAGIQGLPFYGLATSLGAAASAISAALFGDADDEIEDKEENFEQAMGAFAMRGPVNQIFGIDMASRTGFTGMFWREDPRRVNAIGLELYTLEQLLGPFYGSVRSRFDAIRDFQAGYMERGLEKLSPLFLRNILKSIRYARDGVLTKDGKPIVDDIDGYEIVMQAFGFTPTKISEASDRAGARKEIVDKVIDRRQALFESAYASWSQGDQEGYVEALKNISKWNKTKTAAEFNATINWDELEDSFRKRSKAAEEAVDGMTLPKRYVQGAISRVPT